MLLKHIVTIDQYTLLNNRKSDDLPAFFVNLVASFFPAVEESRLTEWLAPLSCTHSKQCSFNTTGG